MGCEGIRMPMLSCPPVTISLTLSALGRIRVSGPGQNMSASRSAAVGQIRDPAVQVARIVQVHDHGVIRRTALDLEYFANGRRVGGIGAQAVNGLRRKYHQVACAQRLDGLFDFGLGSSYHSAMISNEPLHELQVEPAPEFEADFAQMARPLKSPGSRAARWMRHSPHRFPRSCSAFAGLRRASRSASTSARPMPRPRLSARTWTLCSTL